MDVRSYRLICLGFVAFLTMGGTAPGHDVLPDERTALAVGIPILETFFHFKARPQDNYRGEDLGDRWMVFNDFCHNLDPPKPPEPATPGRAPDVIVCVGGSPEVILSKKDARVIAIYHSQ